MEAIKINDVVAVGEKREDLALVEVVAVVTTADGLSYRVRPIGQKREREVPLGKIWRLVRPAATGDRTALVEPTA